MGYADYLSVGVAHVAHDVRHLFGNASAHSRVNLVENDSGQSDSLAYHSFE